MRSPERAEQTTPAMGSSVPTAASDVKHLAERLNAAQIKVKRLSRLEAALVDFFMEVMDRSSSNNAASDPLQQQQPQLFGLGASEQHADSAFARQKRKEQFLRKADGDPISLLNTLRTHLRIQFAAQSEQHQRLNSSLSTIASHTEIQEKSARHELEKLQATNDALRTQVDTLVQQVSTSERARRCLDQHYKSCLEQLSGELHKLRAQDEASGQRIHQQQLEVEKLKQTCDALAKEKRKLLDDVNGVTAGSSDLQGRTQNGLGESSNRSNTGSSYKMTPADADKLQRALREYESKMSRLEAANEEWRLEAQRLQQHIVGLRLNKQVQMFQKLDKDFKKTKVQAGEAKRKLTEVETELLRTKAALKERDARIQQMKDEYNKLFTALQKIKTPSTTQSSSSSATPALASGGHSPSKLTRLASKLFKPVASTPNLVGSATLHGITTSTSNSSVAASGTGASTIGSAGQVNDHPYLIEHYKERIELLENEIEGLKVQIRKMIASEYRYKQKNRLFCAERTQLADEYNRLRGELDQSVFSSAKSIVAGVHDHLAVRSRVVTSAGDLTASRASSGGSAAVNEVKRLRMRNQFLEERFRTAVAPRTGSEPIGKATQASAAAAAIERKASASPIAAVDMTSACKDPTQLHESSRHLNQDDCFVEDTVDAASMSVHQPSRHSSVKETKADLEELVPSSAPLANQSADVVGSDAGSLDAKTLQALQQVRSKARIRPQSASFTNRR